MKNVFVLFGLALLVGSMMFVAQPADAAIATSRRMSQLNVMEDLDYRLPSVTLATVSRWRRAVWNVGSRN